MFTKQHHGNLGYITRINKVYTCRVMSDDFNTVAQFGGDIADSFDFLYGNYNPIDGLEIKDKNYSIADNSNPTSSNGAIILEQSENVLIENCNFKSSDEKKHGQTLHLLGCNDVIVRNCNFHNRISGISAFYCNRILIENCTFTKFNEAIDFDKTSSDITIRNCSFKYGSKYSNEVIDMNSVNGAVIEGCTFTDCGRVLFFNGKEGVTQTYSEWLNLFDLEDPLPHLEFVKGQNLRFINNRIDNCACHALNSLFVLGNKEGKGEPTENLYFNNNSVTNSGRVIVQEVKNYLKV